MKNNDGKFKFFDNVYVLAKNYREQHLAGKEGTILGVGQGKCGKLQYSVRLLGESITRTFFANEITTKKSFIQKVRSISFSKNP